MRKRKIPVEPYPHGLALHQVYPAQVKLAALMVFRAQAPSPLERDLTLWKVTLASLEVKVKA